MSGLAKTRIALVAGLALTSLLARAAYVPQEVVVTKASDNRTLTVRYSGAKASLIEVRLNGKSVANRAVNAESSNGETNFTLETAQLADGDNNLEIRLLDADGKVLATEKTVVTVDRTASGPIFLAKPTPGESVQGFVEISVGFQHQIKNAYVSFFVDDQFKSLRNYAPYTYLWDTSKATNGWHEVEAWVVDESSNTFKTQRLRVFVNNPGGRTGRLTNPAGNPPAKPVTPARPNVTAPKAASSLPLDLTNGAPLLAVSKPTGGKAVAVGHGTMTGLRVMRPTGGRVAGTKPSVGAANAPKVKMQAAPAQGPAQKQVQSAVPKNLVAKAAAPKANAPKPVVTKAAPKAASTKPEVKAAPSRIVLDYGTRFGSKGTYDVYMNGHKVGFDVQPRFDAGIALTPFRHLFESAGGEVAWNGGAKAVTAKGQGQNVRFVIGDGFATVNGDRFEFERAAFLDRGRAIVPMSFMGRLLNVEVAYDPATKHVLVTKASK
ncbi:MAG: hypothetical protein JST30_14895 [Armatimonadetes bacterium]|nr:hypothetical protein [Armatimonadota bacterium]